MVRYQSRSKTIVEKKIDFSYFEIACNIFNAEKKEFRTLSKEMNLGKNNNKRIYDFLKKISILIIYTFLILTKKMGLEFMLMIATY